jgi:hypothetical protein
LKKILERLIGEVMEKEICDNEFCAWSGLSPLMYFGRDKRRKPILPSQKVERGV